MMWGAEDLAAALGAFANRDANGPLEPFRAVEAEPAAQQGTTDHGERAPAEDVLHVVHVPPGPRLTHHDRHRDVPAARHAGDRAAGRCQQP